MIEIHKKISVFTLFLITVISSFLLFNDTSAAPDQELTYHGKLTDTSNVAVPDGDYDFTIVMYDAETGGNCLWSARGDCTTPTSKTLTVTNGTFSTTLGESGDNALSSLDFSSNYYLGITIGTNSEMTPRRKITPTGFALNSHRLNGLEAKESGADAHILATNTNGDAEISGDFTVNSNDLFVDTTSGRVGIGMNNPGSKLQVEGDIIAGNTQTSGESRLRLVGDTGNGISYLQAGNSSVDTSARLHLTRFFTADTELEEFRVYAAESYISGNFGIGVTEPMEALSIDGRIEITQQTAPVTTANKIYNVGGNLYWDGINLTVGGSLPIGTTSHTLRYDGTSWVTSSVLQNNGTSLTIAGDILPEMTGATGNVSTRSIGSSTQRLAHLWADEVHIGAHSLYVNDKKVIEDVADTMTFQTDNDQAVNIQTQGIGTLTLQSDNAALNIMSNDEIHAQAVGGMEWIVPITSPAKHMNFTNSSANGNITFSAAGTNAQVQFSATDEIDLTASIIDVNGDMDVSGAINLGNTTSSNAGSIRWTGTDFEGYDGSSWNSLISSGASSFLSLTDTPSSYTAGSVLFTSGATVTEDNTNFFWDDTNNRLGIGTMIPDYALDVRSGGIQVRQDSDNAYMIARGGTNYDAGLLMYENSDYRFAIRNDASQNTLSFYNASTLSDSMVIDYSGNVGIGTTTPDYKLQVDGDIVPEVDDTYTLGTATLRWQDVYIGSNSLHIGEDGDEVVLSYDTTAGTLEFSQPTTIVGSMQLTNDTSACNASKEGTMRYNDSTKAMEFCDGTGWGSLASGGSGSTTNGEVFSFQVVKTASQTAASGDVVTWDAEIEDAQNVFDLVNDKFIAPQDGTYYFHVEVMTNDTYGGTYRLYKNGVSTGISGFGGDTSDVYTQSTISATLTLEEGDEITIHSGVGQSVYGSLTYYHTRFSGFLVSGGSGTTLPTCTDGQTLSYNETLGEWECADNAGGSGGGWVHSGQQVFSGTSPTSWTDLDFSSIVGQANALVMLKVASTETGDTTYEFRANGDDTEYVWGYGASSTVLRNSGDYVVLETDSNGVIEWNSTGLFATTIDLLGYVGTGSSSSGSGQNWSLMHVQDQKTDGTNGGTSVTGSNQRDLNTVVTNEIAGASLSSNTVTLPAGEYYAEAYSLAYAYSSQRHKIDLEDASGTLLVSGVNADTGGYNARSVLSGKFTLTAETDVVIDDYISTGRATDGLGSAVSGDGRPEIYTDVRFWKIESAAASSSLWAELGDNVYFDTGNIGIGTSAPTSIFEVQGNDTVARFSNENASGADTGINIIGARNGLIAGDTAYIDFSDYDSDEGVGTEFQMARISGGMNDMSGQTGMLKFSTNGGSGLVERMYIDKNGVMNINSFNGGLGITLNDGGGSVDVGSDILFSAQGLLASESNMFFNIDTDADETGAIFAFGKNSDTSAAARVMTITEGGLVGIGADVSAPEQEMHIASYSPTIRLSDVNAANDTEVATFIEWYRGANTNRTGWLGFGSPLDANMSMTNHVGDILLSPTGSVGISNTSPAYKLEISGGDVNTTSGGYRDAGGCVAGTCASDINLKEDIEPITDSLEKILDLKPSTFKFIDSKYGSTELNYGFIAQELEEIYPEWVTIDEGDGYKRVKYGLNIQMATINAIQEQNSLITTNDFTIKEAAKSVNELQISTNDQFAKVSTLFASTRDDAGENDTLRSDILLLQTESNEQADILDYIQGRVAVAEAGISLLNALTDNDPTRLVDLLAIDVDNLLFVNQEGTLEGDLTIEGIVTAESLVVDTVSARVVTAEGVEIRESDSANKTVGTGVIVSGETEVYIETGAVTENSRIFVTPRGRIEKILAIDGTDEGQGFTVGIMDTSDEDIAFDWFIVTEVNNEEEVGEMIEEIGMSDLEREDVNE